MTQHDESAIAAADRWDGLADDQIDLAGFYARQGHHVESFYHRAKVYRRTAETLRREARTGLDHCSSCGGAHGNHLHGHFENGGCACGSPVCPWCMDRDRPENQP